MQPRDYDALTMSVMLSILGCDAVCDYNALTMSVMLSILDCDAVLRL